MIKINQEFAERISKYLGRMNGWSITAESLIIHSEGHFHLLASLIRDDRNNDARNELLKKLFRRGEKRRF